MAVRKRLGEMLLEAGVIDQHQLDAALGHQRKWGGRLGQALVDLKITSEASIVEALSRKFGYEVVHLEGMEAGPVLEAALRLVPREVAARHNVLPYAADTSTVSVAMSDPGNIGVVDEIRFRAGRRVKVALAGDREIAAAVRRLYSPGGREPASPSLELDEFDPGETVVEKFGSGSSDALDQFFAAPAGRGPATGAPGPGADASPAPAAEPDPSVPESVELEDFLTPSPAPLRAVEAVARAQAQGPGPAAAPRASPSAAPAPRPAAQAAGLPEQGAGRPAPAPRPAGHAAGPAAHAAGPAAQAAAAPAQRAAAAGVAAPETGPGEEPGEKTGTLELTLDAEIRPEGTEDLWSQGPVPARPAAPKDGAAEGTRDRPAEREVEILGAIEQLAQGDPVPPELVKPSQLAAALLRLLIRKKLVSFEEFLDEFGKK
ncbi:MAG TPA: hypothetical protein VFR85_05965 [Anaeromyxobacteraceae bacterium]|nr:hypothetical protein [Anaeromyxobacteraceae bacterium]